jgi:hypothetical protein
VQRLVWACFHAFPAPDAAIEKILFIQSSRRTDEPGISLHRQPWNNAEKRERRRTRRRAREHSPTRKVGTFKRCIRARKELELDPTFRTLSNAIEAEMAFRLAPRNSRDGVISALAMQQATVAIFAAVSVLLETENRQSRNQAQKRPQGTERPAPKSGNPKIEREDSDEYQSKEKSLAKIRLLEVEHRCL